MNKINKYISAETLRIQFQDRTLLQKCYYKLQCIYRTREGIKYIQKCIDLNLVPTFVKVSEKTKNYLGFSNGELFRMRSKKLKKALNI